MSYKLTVLMPAYNVESYISQAICSLLSQTYQNFKLVILDDGSTDNTNSIIRKFSALDNRIVHISHSKNMGIMYSRQRLVELVDTEYFAWMDSDDIAPPERLSMQVQELDANPKVGVVSGYDQFFGDLNLVRSTPTKSEEIKAALFADNVVTMPSTIRTNYFRQSGFSFVTCGLNSATDYAQWAAMSAHCDIVNLSCVVNLYRRHQSQESTRFVDRQRGAAKKIMASLYQRLGVTVPEYLIPVLRLFPEESASKEQTIKIAKLYSRALAKNREVSLVSGKYLKAHLAASFRRHCKTFGLLGVVLFIYYFGPGEFFRGQKYGWSFIKYCFKYGGFLGR